MDFLRKYLDKIKPNFEEGGKFSKLRSTFDAFETFLFVPNKVTNRGAHVRDSIDLKRTMSIVVISLIPALLFGIWNVGFQHFRAIGETVGFWEMSWFGFLKVFPIIVVSYVSGLGVEFIFAQIRKHEVNEGFLVSGMLIPMIMPVDVPLWMVAVATIFAVIIGKEVFGGTGMNIFNPALLARAFIFFAYPSKMSGDFVWISGLSDTSTKVVDGFSGATPLALAAQNQFEKIPSLMEMFIGTIPGSIGETSKLAILIGAAILIITGIASLRIMLSAIVGAVLMILTFNLVGANQYMMVSPLQQLMMGGFLFGVVFMATDPVSSTQTATGKIIYGFLIGVMSMLIRVVNPAYPEGMMLAILLLNSFAPLIDYYVVQANVNRRLKRTAK
ncbi:MAG TPA: NADH:ubiquinone reductase (Na(+)-transporting) subunit B [Bacteroidales bacterium]|nr:MAG: NADH:ubiquinone reductase (Na(+)-transporting) subunit B [Bacteroidetes bacterium GWF2_33_38]OFY75489.1 MAG: NADH:ubiquinone reductase (Na(+)-transporting) subunit B [Bacteroidetes bacterium RIFOXYA12_FULL_33_9]OFY85465.1 MAG: NADH:ubiquinone reductase (Na(+)-transporting) subunit B [Bacteroidetes bacterium RIFOXYA2_FULL_33_7]HBF87862.1 NADH:ubiquinone reductase (Na(+)-transporting) subunit B [Bacteroidales bacterium]